ncbi:hypothetical protein L195_g051266 [Trifolium pratense]|uniref:Uncharacterized protein n=1 Tax=Trifolium pratense TaxID=57577 RepID=A0A2K3JYK8_TRIPR|nr:hypothetical protein L195_g051266 [Trifolium pratense]
MEANILPRILRAGIEEGATVLANSPNLFIQTDSGVSSGIKWFQTSSPLPITVAGDRIAFLPTKFSINHH